MSPTDRYKNTGKWKERGGMSDLGIPKTLEIPIRRCPCSAIMEIECFRPYGCKDGDKQRFCDFWRLRWKCPDCSNTARIVVNIG